MSETLRSSEIRDRAALVDLWVAAWTAAMPAIDFEARRVWFENHRNDLESAGARTIVAEDAGGAPLGFVTIELESGYLDQLAVAPAAQGRGIGRRLLAEARRLSPRRLALQVNQDNRPAVRFYEREGFRRIGSGSNPRSGLPVWHMEWQPLGADGGKVASERRVGARSTQERATMDEDAFNMALRKFLKEVGVTSQREIERLVHDGLAKGPSLRLKMTLVSEDVPSFEHVIEHTIDLG